jgi:2'-5' RNA ligase
MFAIISELDERAAIQVMHLWRRLNQSCGLEGIFNYPNPHFTWFSAEDIEIDRCSPILEAISRETHPFTVHTARTDVFEGDDPVLYLKIVKSAELVDLHRRIWDQVLPYVKIPNELYSPNLWIPHITLSLRDLTEENLPCAIQSIANETLEMDTKVTSFSLVKSENQQTGETVRVFELGEGWVEA